MAFFGAAAVLFLIGVSAWIPRSEKLSFTAAAVEAQRLGLHVLDLSAPADCGAADISTLASWAFEEEGPELREYLGVVWRRRWLALLFFAGVVVSAGALTLAQTPTYTAFATLLIEPRDPQVLDIKHVLDESYGYESSYYTTQNEMLRSRSLAARVIETSRVAEEPAFVPLEEPREHQVVLEQPAAAAPAQPPQVRRGDRHRARPPDARRCASPLAP